jgi:peptidoglycan lytic transglycosylase G
VLNPAETEDVYFVADGSGGHVFSRTLTEHSENVKEWRKIEEERRIAQEAAEAAAAAATTAVTEAAATAVADAAAAAAGAEATGKIEALAAQAPAAGEPTEASPPPLSVPETRLVTVSGHVVPLPKAKPRQD